MQDQRLEQLLPRRREIIEVIREHGVVSLDFLHRRFLLVSPRLLSYDLFKLVKAGFVVKMGVTRGAMYKIKGQ